MTTYRVDIIPPEWYNPYALSFDGVDDYVSVPSIAQDIHAVEFQFYTATVIDHTTSASVPVNLQGTFESGINFGSSSGVMVNEIISIHHPSNVRCYWASTTENIAIGWHHLAIYWTGSKYQIVLDGEEKTTSTSGTPSLLQATDIFLGKRKNNDLYFNGFIDDFRLWGTPGRTLIQIQANMNRELIGNETGLVGYWKFNEGTGTTAADSTANANNGTITGATWTTDAPFFSYDITGNTRLVSLERQLGEASAVLDIDCFNLDQSYVMDNVQLSIDGEVVFAGIVKEQSDGKSGDLKVSKLRCVDNTDKLQRRIVVEVYENQTAKQMILDLIATYASYVNTSAVQDIGSTIELLRFEYDTLATAIQKIADITGAYWYLDASDGLHFFENYEGTASVNFAASSNILKDSFTLRTTAVDLCNRVWVIGAKQAASNYIDQYWTGDGNNAVYSVAYVPNYPEVYEDGVSKTIEVDKGGTSTKDYTYDKKNKVLKRVAGDLPNGVLLRLRYRPTTQIIDYFEEPSSVATYGLYEKAIRDKKITDKAAARKRGRSELKKTKALVRIPGWSSRDWNVNPGELTHVTVSSYSFDADCRIDRLSIDFTPADIVAQIEATEVFIS